MGRQQRRRTSSVGSQSSCQQCFLPSFLFLVAMCILLVYAISMSVRKTDLRMDAQFSLWAMPAKNSPLRKRLQDMIDMLAYESGTPRFEPHVTLIGVVGSPQGLREKDVKERSQILAKNLKPFPLKATYVSSGNTYYQCVYILMEKSIDAMLANMRARIVFGQETWEGDWREDSPRMSAHANSSGYMPHLSLLYADLGPERARRFAAKVAARTGALVAETEFEVTTLSLYRTNVADEDLTSWHLVAEYPLGGAPS